MLQAKLRCTLVPEDCVYRGKHCADTNEMQHSVAFHLGLTVCQIIPV